MAGVNLANKSEPFKAAVMIAEAMCPHDLMELEVAVRKLRLHKVGGRYLRPKIGDLMTANADEMRLHFQLVAEVLKMDLGAFHTEAMGSKADPKLWLDTANELCDVATTFVTIGDALKEQGAGVLTGAECEVVIVDAYGEELAVMEGNDDGGRGS